jgi:hypothetical protein
MAQSVAPTALYQQWFVDPAFYLDLLPEKRLSVLE